ncbi:MAG TPA: phage tail sheath subtilisin-like domain-containing protein [Longimicrobium sp.]|nr:phage tail sheath subtilisin-like domain-containing protein [Longimicrobium sp.]
MPSVLTYPGVYVEELPSGVRTISGVGTSITAFVGYTAAGPLNRAVRVFNFGDFERSFGGLNRKSDVSYAINQFFQNGGTDAYVVRVASGAAAASVRLNNFNDELVLTATAATPGVWGNEVTLKVDYDTGNPESTFNLFVTRTIPGGATETEEFRNLSMSSVSPAYAVAVVTAGSRLIQLKSEGLPGAVRGVSLSGVLTPFAPLTPAQTRVTGVLNGSTAFNLTLVEPQAAADLDDVVVKLNNAIAAAGQAAGMEAARTRGDGTNDAAGDHVALRSLTAGETSSVVVTAAPLNDASAALKLGRTNGGRERDGSAHRRPAPTGTTSADLSGATAPNANLKLTIVDQSTGATLDNPAAFNFNHALNAGLAPALQTALRGAVPGARGQAITVKQIGNRLHVFLDSPNHPHAKLLLTDVAATEMGFVAPPSAETNVERYVLGAAASFGAQIAGAKGSDGDVPGATDYLGSQSEKTGIYALRDVDLFNILCIPGTATLAEADAKAVIGQAVALCTEERAFMVVDPPHNSTRDSVAAWAVAATGTTRNAAVYWPRILASDPLEQFRVRSMPASGAIAGVFSRTDAERGVWKAPAGTEAALRGTQGLAFTLTDMENGPLNKVAVNALRTFPAFGSVVWGARTRAGSDDTPDDYKYVPVRRLALYMEESLYRGTQWVVFEPNAEPLWAQIRLNVGAFMNNLFRQGAFKGTTPAQAYLVRCDHTTTTQNDIDLGIVRVVVGFAPLKPAEFVILQIQQLAGQVAV